MAQVLRRDVLKGLAAGALAASGIASLLRPNTSVAADLRYSPEKGAELKLLRWKPFVQGDEDQWLANAHKFTEQTGVRVLVETVNLSDIRAKAHLAASVGAGPDILVGGGDDPQLYPDQCLDLTELANYLGEKYGGWYDACRHNCTLDGRWLALGLAFYPFCVVYRESMIKAVGFGDIPQDLPGFLRLCQALKARGTPVGLTLGNAPGDANAWCHWLIWTHGATLVDENNRVTINSKQTIAALEYARALYATFIPGTLSWLDPSNNKAFLAGAISLTYNPISIYYVAKTSSDPAMKAVTADIQHAHLPIGPIGRRTEYAGFAPILIFKHTKYPNAAREYLRFLFERDQYEAWEKASSGYVCQTLRSYESNPIWTADPKITPFREGGALSLYSGYPGKVGPASAACLADFIIVNMVAEAASGQSTPKDAAARAEQRARRYYKT
jgi:multiple sugar transport system substrate-binding protein